jgi:hypothetical protein
MTITYFPEGYRKKILQKYRKKNLFLIARLRASIHRFHDQAFEAIAALQEKIISPE